MTEPDSTVVHVAATIDNNTDSVVVSKPQKQPRRKSRTRSKSKIVPEGVNENEHFVEIPDLAKLLAELENENDSVAHSAMNTTAPSTNHDDSEDDEGSCDRPPVLMVRAVNNDGQDETVWSDEDDEELADSKKKKSHISSKKSSSSSSKSKISTSKSSRRSSTGSGASLVSEDLDADEQPPKSSRKSKSRRRSSTSSGASLDSEDLDNEQVVKSSQKSKSSRRSSTGSGASLDSEDLDNEQVVKSSQKSKSSRRSSDASMGSQDLDGGSQAGIQKSRRSRRRSSNGSIISLGNASLEGEDQARCGIISDLDEGSFSGRVVRSARSREPRRPDTSATATATKVTVSRSRSRSGRAILVCSSKDSRKPAAAVTQETTTQQLVTCSDQVDPIISARVQKEVANVLQDERRKLSQRKQAPSAEMKQEQVDALEQPQQPAAIANPYYTARPGQRHNLVDSNPFLMDSATMPMMGQATNVLENLKQRQAQNMQQVDASVVQRRKDGERISVDDALFLTIYKLSQRIEKLDEEQDYLHDKIHQMKQLLEKSDTHMEKLVSQFGTLKKKGGKGTQHPHDISMMLAGDDDDSDEFPRRGPRMMFTKTSPDNSQIMGSHIAIDLTSPPQRLTDKFNRANSKVLHAKRSAREQQEQQQQSLQAPHW